MELEQKTINLLLIFINRMWNQISCNKIVSRKSVEKENARLTESLRHTKSSLRSTTNYKSMSKSRATLGQKNWELFKQNKKLTSRIESIQRSRNSKSMDRMTTNTSILRLIQNNKRRITDLKQKSIQKANKKLLQKIVSANSTLKTLRLKTTLEKSGQKAKPKPILFMSDQKPQSQLSSLPSIQKNDKKMNAYPKYMNEKLKSSPKSSNKQNSRKVKTQTLDISEVINVQQNDTNKNKSLIQDDVVVQEWNYADDGLVEEILDAEQ